MQKVFGRKIKGLRVTGIIINDGSVEKVPVVYYDEAGNELETPANFEYSQSMMPAVKVKVDKKTAGQMRLFMDCYSMFDQYY